MPCCTYSYRDSRTEGAAAAWAGAFWEGVFDLLPSARAAKSDSAHDVKAVVEALVEGERAPAPFATAQSCALALCTPRLALPPGSCTSPCVAHSLSECTGFARTLSLTPPLNCSLPAHRVDLMALQCLPEWPAANVLLRLFAKALSGPKVCAAPGGARAARRPLKHIFCTHRARPRFPKHAASRLPIPRACLTLIRGSRCCVSTSQACSCAASARRRSRCVGARLLSAPRAHLAFAHVAGGVCALGAGCICGLKACHAQACNAAFRGFCDLQAEQEAAWVDELAELVEAEQQQRSRRRRGGARQDAAVCAHLN